MEKAGDILGKLFKELPLSGKREYLSKGASLFERWKDIAGEEIASRSSIREIERGCLIVEVEHSGISQLIMMKKKAIIRTLKKKYPSLEIHTIRTLTERDNRKKKRRAPAVDHTEGAEGEGKKEKINTVKKMETEGLLRNIEDTQLKSALERLKKTLEKKKKTAY